MELIDDFSLLVEYLSRLFAIKKMRDVTVHQYQISFLGYSDISTELLLQGFPDRGLLDRVKMLRLGIHNFSTGQNFLLDLSWDRAESPDGNTSDVTNFIEVLDSSTFRYF